MKKREFLKSTLVWTSPVVTAVVLPAHAKMSALECPRASLTLPGVSFPFGCSIPVVEQRYNVSYDIDDSDPCNPTYITGSFTSYAPHRITYSVSSSTEFSWKHAGVWLSIASDQPNVWGVSIGIIVSIAPNCDTEASLSGGSFSNKFVGVTGGEFRVTGEANYDARNDLIFISDILLVPV